METILHLDHFLFHFINHTLQNRFFDLVCPVIRNDKFLYLVYILICLRVYQLFPQHFVKILAVGAVTFLLTDQLSSAFIKPYFHRLRPCNNPAMQARLVIEYCGVGYSFVSSHAANTAGIATLLFSLALNRLTAGLILGTWVFAVCLSQVYVGVHYPGNLIDRILIDCILSPPALRR